MKSQGSSLSGSQSLHEQPAKGMAGFQEALTVTSHRTEMPRQNSDPTSENPPLPPRIEKFDRSSWLRQEEDIPPKVTLLLLAFSTSESHPRAGPCRTGLTPVLFASQWSCALALCSAPLAKLTPVGLQQGLTLQILHELQRRWELLLGARTALQNSIALQQRKFSSPDQGQNKSISPCPKKKKKSNLLFK